MENPSHLFVLDVFLFIIFMEGASELFGLFPDEQFFLFINLDWLPPSFYEFTFLGLFLLCFWLLWQLSGVMQDLAVSLPAISWEIHGFLEDLLNIWVDFGLDYFRLYYLRLVFLYWALLRLNLIVFEIVIRDMLLYKTWI